jgi:carbon monoxide dehydrogenase subunit G
MDMSGERRIMAPREKVWAALNDPQVLKASIPGCESIEKLSDHEMRATAAVKIGPIAARFSGKVSLLDLDPPASYRIEGEGQGGVAGFAKGGAVVKLVDEGAATLLTYDVKAQMAEAFFTRFAAEVMATPPAATGADGLAGAIAAATQAPAPTRASAPAMAPAKISLLSMIPTRPLGYPLVVWIGGIICLVIFIMIFGSYL